MQIIHAGEQMPETISRSIFLIGPTPRSPEVPSWRPQALQILKDAGFDGTVFVPESRDGARPDYLNQESWEHEAMAHSDVLLVWAAINNETMPGLSTRTEFGENLATRKLVFGAPEGSYKTRFMSLKAKRYAIETHTTLKDTVDAAMTKLGAGATRCGGETKVPLEVWKTPYFQDWYRSQSAAGHKLLDVQRVEWGFGVGPGKKIPLYVALHVSMAVAGENRVKSNEVVVLRPSTGVTAVFAKGKTPDKDRFVLVREYRTTANNPLGFVVELPGGATFKEGASLEAIAQMELKDEARIDVPVDRLIIGMRRQFAPTMIGNTAQLISLELSNEEMDRLAAEVVTAGNESEESERTHRLVMTRAEILVSPNIGWETLGMVSAVG